MSSATRRSYLKHPWPNARKQTQDERKKEKKEERNASAEESADPHRATRFTSPRFALKIFAFYLFGGLLVFLLSRSLVADGDGGSNPATSTNT